MAKKSGNTVDILASKKMINTGQSDLNSVSIAGASNRAGHAAIAAKSTNTNDKKS